MTRLMKVPAGAVMLLLAALAASPGGAAAAQEELPPSGASADSLPADTYATPGVRALVERARAARGRHMEGIHSYEGLLNERVYVGLTSPTFRRERTLFEQEDAARIRWTSSGERAIQWLSARRAVPIIGAATALAGEAPDSGSVAADMERDLRRDLTREGSPMGFAFDPWDDRIVFGDSHDWALHPLADSAAAEYRYLPGDTLTLGLPDGRRVTLVEVRVEPREADFHRVVGSLWFDEATGALARASYRPARAFDLEREEPEDAKDVPGIFRPVTVDVGYVTVEYALYDLRWWLPRRFSMQGTARMGRLLTVPLLMEWSVKDYRVNPEESALPLTDSLPPGWTRSERPLHREGEADRTVTILVPPADSLRTSAGLLTGVGERSPVAFDEDEIAAIRHALDGLAPAGEVWRPRLSWGLQDGLVRYNRVEGLSAGVGLRTPVPGGLALHATARLGVADLAPRGELAVLRGPETAGMRLAGYRRLEAMGEMETPFGPLRSLQNLLLGGDRGQYYDAAGVEAARTTSGPTFRSELRVFWQRERAVDLGTDFFLLQGVRGRSPEPLLAADEGSVGGVAGLVRWQAGANPAGLIATGSVRGEAAGGDFTYGKASATVALAHPLPGTLAGALEVGAGAAWGDVPIQKEYFLGGPRTVRGFDMDALQGTAFWLARGEVANGFAGARLALFADAGWAGPRDTFGTSGWVASVGAGTSLLDGLVRFDVARAVRGGRGWEVHAYLDGLF